MQISNKPHMAATLCIVCCIHLKTHNNNVSVGFVFLRKSRRKKRWKVLCMKTPDPGNLPNLNCCLWQSSINITSIKPRNAANTIQYKSEDYCVGMEKIHLMGSLPSCFLMLFVCFLMVSLNGVDMHSTFNGMSGFQAFVLWLVLRRIRISTRDELGLPNTITRLFV